MFFNHLVDWFLKNKREFPWREGVSPYKVLVSEIMLQQTKAVAVVDYFERWMVSFPDIQTLATAPLESVIKAWEGLGYYSRARNLHLAAKYIIDKHYGIVPDNREDLEKVPGIGPYTAGAILSFACHKKAAAIDGNVLRVLTRLLGDNRDITKASTKKHLQQLLETMLSDKAPWIEMEALIELGALVCQKTPICYRCPLQKDCLAYQRKEQALFPVNSKKYETIKASRVVFCIFFENKVLVKKNAPGQIMADLWEFPYLENEEEIFVKAIYIKDLKKVVHYYTKYQVSLFPKVFQAEHQTSYPGYEWIDLFQLEKLAFSSGHKKVMQQLFS
ncbi:MAG: A/G-specific adenine glycosylase [Chlamydiales bacterium]|nr:A/G-specific adenine glycosylase [Chlamydiales bacterium]